MFYSGPREWWDCSKTENGDYKSDISFMRENRLYQIYDYKLHLLDSHHAASRKVMGRVRAVLRPVHNTTLNNALRCVVFASTFVKMQHDTRIDSDPILAFPCVAFLHLVVKKPRLFSIKFLCFAN